MKLEIRYERSFLQDLKALEPAAYQRVRQFVFEEFLQLNQLQDLPGLQQMGASAIYYRFTLDNYLVGIEITGEIVKFVRILPQPDI
ncbi:MAG: cytotoxic translational repressor of toxin-antitoxin stability system [Leptolyngbyaceae cyanobacterium bins.59]|nr:cytotoxic translational repressor of toxin-antitoxin stability system [Leptolyngbyaceae cyanobacterium bins.59]